MLDASLARDDLRPNKSVCLSHIFDKLMFEVTLFSVSYTHLTLPTSDLV